LPEAEITSETQTFQGPYYEQWRLHLSPYFYADTWIGMSIQGDFVQACYTASF